MVQREPPEEDPLVRVPRGKNCNDSLVDGLTVAVSIFVVSVQGAHNVVGLDKLGHDLSKVSVIVELLLKEEVGHKGEPTQASIGVLELEIRVERGVVDDLGATRSQPVVVEKGSLRKQRGVDLSVPPTIDLLFMEAARPESHFLDEQVFSADSKGMVRLTERSLHRVLGDEVREAGKSIGVFLLDLTVGEVTNDLILVAESAGDVPPTVFVLILVGEITEDNQGVSYLLRAERCADKFSSLDVDLKVVVDSILGLSFVANFDLLFIFVSHQEDESVVLIATLILHLEPELDGGLEELLF